MPTAIASSIAVLALGLPAVATARALVDYDWIEVRTQHFRIVSALPQDESTALATDLENFRSAVELLTSIGRFEERIPTLVYLLPRAEPGLGLSEAAGYMAADMRANYLVVLAARRRTDNILKHEYVHFLVHNRDQALYASWFDEGFAEVFSTLTVSGNVIEYGKADANRTSWLRYGSWMPFAQVLDARGPFGLDSDEDRAMFYAQSWFLTHYLMIGRSGVNFGEQHREFRRLSEVGEMPVTAFEQAFGLRAGGLHETLIDYASKMAFARLTLTEPLPAAQVAISKVARSDVAAQLGILCIRRGDQDAAGRYFQVALEDNPENTVALVGMGDVRKSDRKFDEAQPYYEQAIALASDNALHLLDYAEYWDDRAQLDDDAEKSRAYLTQARTQYARSYKLDAGNLETLAMNGATYLDDPEGADKALASLEAAEQLLPSHPDVRFLLAKAYLAANEPQKALPHLRTLLAWSHSERRAQAVLELLEEAEQPAAND